MAQFTGPVGNELIPKCTPLHVTDMVRLVIKETLASQDPTKFPFVFTDDYATSQVALDSVFNKESEAYGKKPIIIISRGGQMGSPIVIGDLGTMRVKTGNSRDTTIVRSSVEIKVLSKKPKEVDILSQHIFNTLIMSRTMLTGLLGITMIDSVSMSQVSQLEQDDHMYFTAISMPFQMQYSWTNIIPQTIISSLLLYVNENLELQLNTTGG